MKPKNIVFLLIPLIAAGCAGIAALPDYPVPARNFLENYLKAASEPGLADTYFTDRAKWKRTPGLEREPLSEIVKEDRQGALEAFDAVLKAADIEWRNMEYLLRPSTRNREQAEKYQRAAIADLAIALDIVTAFDNAFGAEAAAPLRKRLRGLAERLDPK
ncbi:MAG: hypothetical protein ACYS8W_21560 [Planctomycetota bacterium]|jgi:hypothetical protein